MTDLMDTSMTVAEEAVDEEMPPCTDYDRFAQRVMPDLGHEVEALAHYTWRVTGWRSLEKRITSPEFQCGGHSWRILLFPFGNSNGAGQGECVSVYLDYADPKREPSGWHVCAQFALAMSNPSDPSVMYCSQAHHRFVSEESDWGFTRFNELRKLGSAWDGRQRPIIEGEAVDIHAYVRVLKDPTGVLWHNFINYDSKKETGYVGLKNQGATCYMNSLLQSLFCTNYFRKAVYQIPTEDDTPLESFALALQRVFYLLQTVDFPVGTTELTRSFGWRSLDSFMQHDVQEFNRVLQDKLEVRMKGTAAEGSISRLFVGKMKSFVKCINVKYESAREEDFYDIQLNVKGLKNLDESFKDYVTMETLEGENKYHAEGFGLQDAKKGVIFQSFPPVLHLQLKRFEYDIQRDSMVKINDRHEFPTSIDLGQYLDDDADRSQNYIYHLHGVLVHSGDLHGGHYFALIKPEINARWLKFDDDRVTPVTEREVLEDNYGGEPLNGYPPSARAAVRTMKRFTNAYMLVYIREPYLQEVMSPVTKADTPAHLKERVDEERMLADQKRREREEQHLYLTARIVTTETFLKYGGFDLATFEERNGSPSPSIPSFKVLKSEPFVHFKARVAQLYKVPVESMHLWVLVHRQNKTVRPDLAVPENDPQLTMESVRDKMASRQSDLKLYLEVISPEIPRPVAEDGAAVMILLKHFDALNQELHGLGHVFVGSNAKVSDVIPQICRRMKWPATTAVRLYEEIKPTMIELMKTKQTFHQSEIQDGDIICFQKELTDSEQHQLETQGKYRDPIAFYDFLCNRVTLVFKSKIDETKPDIELVLSRKMNYDTMATKLGEKLNHDPLKLRFTTAGPPSMQPKAIVKRTANNTVQEIMPVGHATTPQQQNVIWYELLDVSIIELETKKSLRVTWMGRHNKEEGTHSLLLPKTSNFNDVAEKMGHLVKLQPGGSGKVRIFEVVNGRTLKDYNGSEMIGNVSEYTELFAEEIYSEELEAEKNPVNTKTITVYHFTKDYTRSHGVPFHFVLRAHEPFHETKKRLQARLDLNDKDFARIRFSLVQTATYSKPVYLADEDVIYDHKFAADDVLGLDHVDKRPKPNAYEKAIFIK